MLLLIAFTVIILLICIAYYKRETFLGAMTQMYARGPMDEYIMSGVPRYAYYPDPLWMYDEPMRRSSYYYC